MTTPSEPRGPSGHGDGWTRSHVEVEANAATDRPAGGAGRPAPGPVRLVLLIGMMGTGKSTVGRILAARLRWRYLDSDEQVKRRTGNTVAELWTAAGEAAFRAEEAGALADAVASREAAVVAVAGGAVMAAANREVITSSGGLVVWLRASPATLTARLGDGAGRPLLAGDPVGVITRLDAERRPLYESLAHLVVDGDRLDPEAVAGRIVTAVERLIDPPPGEPTCSK